MRHRLLNINLKTILLITLTPFLSCKKDKNDINEKIEFDHISKIEGDWVVNKISSIQLSKSGYLLKKDSSESSTGNSYNISLSGGRLIANRDTINYKLTNYNNSSFIRYEIFDKKYNLKLSNINKQIISLESCDSTSETYILKTIFYFKKTTNETL